MSETAPTLPADTEARELLEELVSTPSPTPEETACAEVLADFFERNGRTVFVDEVGNVRAPADDSVLYTSHIDTVPGDIPVRIEEGENGPGLWGRGAVDAKGPLAALAVAAVRTGVSFVGVVGEEVDSRGARHLVDDRDPPEAVVNGEPSGWDGITLGYRGILSGTYICTSESGHTSRPENNAIQEAIAWWSAVEARFGGSSVARDADTDVSDAADVPIFERVTPKPVEIEGGVSEDGLAVETTLDVQLRVPPSYTTEDVREIADGELTAGTVNWTDAVEPTMQSPRTPVARAFRVAIREQEGDPRLLRKTGTADMNIYAEAWDCPVVTYGPGDSDFDHAPNEHLELYELDRAVAVLETVAEELA
ncbi:[LysW]-lysine hydrolase [Natronomonas sp. F2-12]|jgi:LysW-gamma-L-lysine carboxypeptidase|uniref:Putative [LysW]-lysine/[LysW]-ornithine hydrolase n=1 Tax=Natronomonas aquatica TaxID=2841590 RepID=A0A9R1CS56_9EURY|nr:[LysW]-lysine hydrolase [Natronomonas aquatica]MCQ4332915.1 [LysW]-lysine hydrolase [Natronomonas aquatica]